MGLEEALKAVKRVYPLYKPWHYKKRTKALEEVRTLVEEHAKNTQTQEYIEEVIERSVGWFNKDEGLQTTMKTIQAWDQWNPHALDIFAAGFQEWMIKSMGTYAPGSGLIAKVHPMFSVQVKNLAESYKEKFGEAASFGFLEGIRDFAKGVYTLENDVLPLLQREDFQQVLATAKEYGPNIVFAMSKNFSERCVDAPWLFKDCTYGYEKRVLLLENDEARKVYEAYKDAVQYTVSKIVNNMVWTALNAQHQLSRVCSKWNDENVQAIVKDARNYGQEIEEGIFAAIDTIENNKYFQKDRFSFFQTQAFHGLMEKYKTAPQIFAKIAKSIASANSYIEGKDSKDREKIMDAFSRSDVEEVLKKYKDAPSIKDVIDGISKVIRDTSAPETLSSTINVLKLYQERNPNVLENVVSSFWDIARPKRYEDPQAERDINKFIAALAREDVQKILECYNDNKEENKAVVSLIAKVTAQEESAFPAVLNFLTKIRLNEPKDVIEIVGAVQQRMKEHSELIPAILAYLQIEDSAKLSSALSVLSRGSEMYEKVKNKEVTLKEINTMAEMLEVKGFSPTPYLVAELYQAPDKQATIKDWKQTLDSFAGGNFDATNVLHRNLEYTSFRRFIDHEKVKRFIKNQITYAAYNQIFTNPAATSQALSREDQFEVECVAYEAGLLYHYIMQVKERADKLGTRVVVVPNFSYGYLPVSPLITHLEEQDIETLIGVKVGSSECHNNKEVMNSRLFKGHRTELMNEQPVIIVVDGTQHLIAREGDGKGARYPDAHQSYLNQVIAMNDAMGFRKISYDDVGKSLEDCTRLRLTDEYQRTVELYKQLIDKAPKQPFQFALGNTAEMELMVRGDRQEAAKVYPIKPEDISTPTLIFYNVGVLDEQLPASIKEAYPELQHKPAYFDDSGRIIAFDFGYDNYGVRYLNKLETEVKKAFEAQQGNSEVDLTVKPTILRALAKVRASPAYEIGAE